MRGIQCHARAPSMRLDPERRGRTGLADVIACMRTLDHKSQSSLWVYVGGRTLKRASAWAAPPPDQYLEFCRRSGWRGNLIEWRARFSVFFISMAIVIGPTPPGTGVILPAT